MRRYKAHLRKYRALFWCKRVVCGGQRQSDRQREGASFTRTHTNIYTHTLSLSLSLSLSHTHTHTYTHTHTHTFSLFLFLVFSLFPPLLPLYLSHTHISLSLSYTRTRTHSLCHPTCCRLICGSTTSSRCVPFACNIGRSSLENRSLLCV